jgi:hypothetical protein
MANPISFRFPFEAQIASLPPEIQQVHRTAWNKMTSLSSGLSALQAQVNALSPSGAAATTENVTNNSLTTTTTVVFAANVIGAVNNQAGATSYATLQSDYGAFILLNDASPVAVSLASAPVIVLPWYAVIFNEGAGLVTVTPSAGTISYPNNLAAASMPISQGEAALIAYDGTNFTGIILPVVTQNTPAVAHEFFIEYNAVTGAFTAAQPAFTDISGIASPAQLPTPTAGTIGGVKSAGPVAHEWIYEIDTTGTPLLSQPSFSDLSGSATSGQLPAGSVPLDGVSASLGGAPMTVGQTITVAVTVAGAAVGMVAMTSPETYPGDGFVWDAYVSAPNTVTVRLTATLIGTPLASVYDVRCLQ